MPKRGRSNSTASSSSSLEYTIKRSKPEFTFHGQTVKVHILETKLGSKPLYELLNLVEKHQVLRKKDPSKKGGFNLELCPDIREADVIITAIRMRQRLERHLDWSHAKAKAIVTPQWLFDSAEQEKLLPCGHYAALNDLQEETNQNCPDSDDCGCGGDKDQHISYVAGLATTSSTSPTPSLGSSLEGSHLSHTSPFACCRASPLKCPNQALVEQLGIIRRSRELEGEDRSALSYERAIAVLKAFPKLITDRLLSREVSKLPYIGKKLRSMIEEHIKTGRIAESAEILKSPRFQSLQAFAAVYGIGPTTARKLFALGLRTMEDLERYYEADPRIIESADVKTTLLEEGKTIEELTDLSIKVALALRHDFEIKIPRAEVEEMHRTVMNELNDIQPGCVSTIVGGYRRGKPQSNDVDIIITHPDPNTGPDKIKGLCKKLIRRLYDRGLVTHVMHLSGFHSHNALRTTHWDSLEKALTVFILPPGKTKPRIHRRLDLIFAVPEVYWIAITGWSGSRMFERDLRLWAKRKKGMKFDSAGITRRRDSKLFFPKSEREIFDLLGLEYIDPRLRNADA